MALVRFNKLWRKSTPIPFSMTEGIRADNEGNILKAIQDWNDHTVLNLVPLEKAPRAFIEQGGMIRFIRGEENKNCSPVGRQGGTQDIKAANASVGILVHEIGHAIGLSHEQQRFDRAQHVYVVEELIDEDARRNYKLKLPPNHITYGAYDCNSAMHYLPKKMTKDNKDFYYFDRLPWACQGKIGRKKRTLSDGSETFLSANDIAAVSHFYG